MLTWVKRKLTPDKEAALTSSSKMMRCEPSTSSLQTDRFRTMFAMELIKDYYKDFVFWLFVVVCIIIHVHHNHTLDTNLSNKALHYYTTVLLKCSHTLFKLLMFISVSLNILCCMTHISYTLLYMYSNCANYYLIIFIDIHYEHIGVQLNTYSSFCMCLYTR